MGLLPLCNDLVVLICLDMRAMPAPSVGEKDRDYYG